MEQLNIDAVYNNVCNAPRGANVNIDYMPDSFVNDDMDNNSPHVHTFYEIIWFREGEGTHFVDFQEYPVEKNTLFFLSPGQVHCFDDCLKYKGVLIKFCTDFLKDEGVDDDELFIKYNLFQAFDTIPCCTISEATAQRLLFVLGKIQEEYENRNMVGHEDMLRALTKIFLITIQRNSERHDAYNIDHKKPAHRLFVMFRKCLEQHFMEYHTVKEYADVLNVSAKTLSNSVQESAGVTPLTIINDRITLEAKRLLRYSNLITKEIADYLGYDDPSYFVKFFKRQTGYLPSSFANKGGE